MRPNDSAEVLERRSIPEPMSGCKIWLGGLNRGYGRLKIQGHTVYAHVAAYELEHGKVPDGLELDHKCRVRCCIEDHHLEAVTAKENIRRGRLYRKLKTHCPHGHPMVGRNVVVFYGARQCRACRVARTAIWCAKHRRKSHEN